MAQTPTSPKAETADTRPGYVIGHITVLDTVKWADYCAQVPATLAPWGAEIVFRGHRHVVFSGPHAHERTVVIRFPDVEAAVAWHESPAYQALLPLRHQAASVTLLGFDT